MRDNFTYFLAYVVGTCQNCLIKSVLPSDLSMLVQENMWKIIPKLSTLLLCFWSYASVTTISKQSPWENSRDQDKAASVWSGLICFELILQDTIFDTSLLWITSLRLQAIKFITLD